MKIAFITDLHIDVNGVYPLGLDTRTQFIQTLDHASAQGYEVLVLGGDLCHKTGNKEIYQWVRAEALGRFATVWPIPGNHDDPEMMAEEFGLESSLQEAELYYSRRFGDVEFIFLDTSSASMSEPQWQWLSQKIDAQDEDVFIIMHHPPVLAGSMHMEPKYQFAQTDRAAAIFKKYGAKRFHIFCGHYHLERTVVRDNVHIYISPSTFVQIHPGHTDFVKGNDYYSYREIILRERGFYFTSCHTAGSLLLAEV